MAKWIWQSRNWPSLTYDEKTLRPFEDQYLHLGGVARGILDQLDAAGRADVQISLFEKEAMETSAIERVVLDRWSLQSWLRRQLGLRSERRVAPEEAGMAGMIVQLVSSLDEPLSTETLCEWNSLVMAGRSDVDEIGHYRRNPASMQIVSGPTGAYTVHYVAPPSSRVDAEMRTFLAWFNSSSRSIPALGRAGLAHLWFETIHPFADGNGRIGRSISQKVLGCAVGRPPMAMLSDAISRNRDSYYSALNAAQTGGDVQAWLEWFAHTAIVAQERTVERIRFLSKKVRFLSDKQHLLNSRQRSVLLRLWDAGPDGSPGGLSAGNYITITNAATATATRDLADLVAKGVLRKTGERRHTRYFIAI